MILMVFLSLVHFDLAASLSRLSSESLCGLRVCVFVRLEGVYVCVCVCNYV